MKDYTRFRDYKSIARLAKINALQEGSKEFGTVANAARLTGEVFTKRDLSRWDEQSLPKPYKEEVAE